MVPSMKAAFLLLSLLQLIASKPLKVTHVKQELQEIIHSIHQLNAQVPCNDTRVAQIPFMDQNVPEKKLLCQAAMALEKVTKCKAEYEGIIINLRSLHHNTNCSLKIEDEIYLRDFLPELGNFTQGLNRHLARSSAQ
ncbi:IL4 protein, partial [Brachypteracias leptosomus]|nr:IL4 protein [Brachypteracias leptosomus]